jgi:hypothetical protein
MGSGQQGCRFERGIVLESTLWVLRCDFETISEIFLYSREHYGTPGLVWGKKVRTIIETFTASVKRLGKF